jgi:hypothetical protein
MRRLRAVIRRYFKMDQEAFRKSSGGVPEVFRRRNLW